MTDIVTIYGASDDLIEINGAISEEFGAHTGFTDDGDDGGYVAFSDGTVLEIVYGNGGVWRIRRIAKGAAEYRLDEATGDVKSYSDIATLTGDLRWAVIAKQFVARAPAPTPRPAHEER